MATSIWKSTGRANRQRYWLYSLIYPIVVMVVAVFIGIALSAAFNSESMVYLAAIFVVPAAWVSIMVQIQRWHDLNKSALWILLSFIPYLGLIAQLVIGFVKGTPGPNQYGEDPLGGSD